MRYSLAGVIHRAAAIGTVVLAAVVLGVVVAGAAQTGAALPGAAKHGRHVIVAGIGGLRWSDVTPTRTPVLWQLASQGSVGSLVVSGISPRTCPADGWLTLNSAARSAFQHPKSGPCPPVPFVVSQRAPASPAIPAPAEAPALPRLIRGGYNAQFHYNPQWGLLGRAAGSGRCATAVGPGAALALASPAGRVASYLASPARLTRGVLARCALAVIDLGDLPASGSPSARAAAARAADRELGAIRAAMPAGATLAVAAPGDGSAPHLRVLIVAGPGYRNGLLSAASTRQPGIVALTDLTPTVLRWLGVKTPPAVVGSVVAASRRNSLSGVIRMLKGQDAAAQVYLSTVTPFYLLAGFGYAGLFALVRVAPLGRGERRRRFRRAVARAVGVWAAAVPAGTYLASLAPWWTLAHPALALYALAVAWAVLIAAIALAGPWRRDPLGPPGAVAAVTVAVIGLDLMTGSRLALETPFGLSLLEAGRYYGLANNSVVIYAASGILCAAWLGGQALRRGARAWALVIMGVVTAFTVVAAAWPGFGAKVGGTIAMTPGFLLLAAVAAGARLTTRRIVLIAVSGAGLVTAFALINYFAPVTGHSDIGGFAGQLLHGGAGGILHRKINSNFGSLTVNPFALVVPVVLVLLGLVAAWPQRMRASQLFRAYEQIPLLRAAFLSVWLVGVLGWFTEDSGVTVPAAALPLVLPLAVAILSSAPPGARCALDARYEPASGAARTAQGEPSAPGGPPASGGQTTPGDRGVPGRAKSGYR